MLTYLHLLKAPVHLIVTTILFSYLSLQLLLLHIIIYGTMEKHLVRGMTTLLINCLKLIFNIFVDLCESKQ
jgi:hypothetical protein